MESSLFLDTFLAIFYYAMFDPIISNFNNIVDFLFVLRICIFVVSGGHCFIRSLVKEFPPSG